MIVWLSLARAEPPPELGVVWALTIEGAPVGTRDLQVRYEGGEVGERVRIVQAYTEVAGGKGKKEFSFQERLTANSHEARPASFHAVSSADGVTREVQARFGDGVWRVMVATAAGAETSTVNAGRIDLSTVDLLDPESDRRLASFDRVRILSSDLGRVLEGDVVPLGPQEIPVGGEAVVTEGFELRTAEGSWRYWYASNGFLIRYEEPRLGRALVGTMTGSAPRGVDEFPVSPLPVIESIPLP